MTSFSSPSGQFWRADPPVHDSRSDGTPLPAIDLPPGAVPAERLIDQLQSAAQVLSLRLAEHFQEFGLNEIRYSVMRIVASRSPHGCSQTDLAESIHQSESSVSTLVERMRSDNLVYRLRSKLDRRKRVLILTERGQAVLQHIQRCHAERLERMLSRFEQHERRDLSRLLQQFIDHLTMRASEAGERSSAAPASHLQRVPSPAERAAADRGETV
jgi:DNA-binding MarR family transcriptional regulator